MQCNFITQAVDILYGTLRARGLAYYGTEGQGSVRDEPGCFRFDIHQDAEVPTRFYLYKVYTDEAAFQAHLETPHFLTWKGIVE